MANVDVVNTLKLPQRELDEIVAELNRANAQSAARSKRKLKRWVLQQQKVILTLLQSNGVKTHGASIPRNISKSGAAVVYGCFVHPGAKCFLSLRCVDGTTRSVGGVVMHCRHVKGNIHDLGIAFTSVVNPRDFFIVQGNDYLFNREHVDIRSIKGKVLIVEDSVAVQRLLAHDLRMGDLTLLYARKGSEVMDCMTEEPDMLLVDYGLPDTNGIDLVRSLRDQGFSQPIVMMTAERDKELRLAAIGAGASEMLFKPITTELLHRSVAEYLSTDSGDEDRPGSAASKAMKLSEDDISTYIESLVEIAANLERALEEQDAEKLRLKLLEVASTAEQYGFRSLGEQASEVLRLLDMQNGLIRASTEVKRLVRMCEKARPSH